MINKISVVVSMLCEGTPKVKNTIQESLDVFIALSGYSVEEMIGDKNLVDELDLEYGSVSINIIYNN